MIFVRKPAAVQKMCVHVEVMHPHPSFFSRVLTHRDHIAEKGKKKYVCTLVRFFKYCSDLFRLEVQFPFIMDSIKSCFSTVGGHYFCMHLRKSS